MLECTRGADSSFCVLRHTHVPRVVVRATATPARRLIPNDNILFALVAQLHWWGANMMPLRRGSAIDAITKALLQHKGIRPGAWRPFVRVYPTFFK